MTTVIENVLPMLTLNGLLMNSFMGNVYIDKETGETTPASLKIQVICDVPQKAGGIRKELVTMSVRDETKAPLYQSMEGKMIRVAVGVIPQGRNLNFWILPHTSPELVDMSRRPSPAASTTPVPAGASSSGASTTSTSSVKSPL